MGEDSARGDVELLLRVARLYYEEHRTQAEIAREIGYSRPSVSRLLTRARNRGIVRISISHPLEHILSVEKRLREALPLKTVRVTEVDGSDIIGAIGRAGSQLLVDSISNGQVIAVGNGRTVQATAQQVPQIPRVDCTIVQLLGSIPGGVPAWGRDAPTICTRIASQLGAKVSRMPVPLIVDDPTLLRPLMREEKVATTLALAARADVALVGVAGVEAKGAGNILAEYLTADVREAIREGGAVGHILDHHYDAAGRPVPTPLTPRTLALPLEELRQIPLVIGVAGGEDKVEAIVGAVRGGILSALATDYQTALSILDSLHTPSQE
ncbi:sugar-binding transcriptional regulator [Actinomyces sp. MRS3W]|uniref:sugar-binding transcriptional regulator n=1 Tax=Actinomyces sp. MRS3W TaxID=2800796 RepID=UPI0028FD208E|nr:sugar-binding transcriptional regulator [Actinomyces sp. MRS3W]MDU0349631.1 sugar-binding transcriptional regulator [Actinomyces sp. MRS3W]